VRRSLLALVGALVLTEVMFYSALTPLLPHYAHRLDLSKGAAGLLTASYAIGTLIFALPLGIAIGRIGAKRGTIAGTLALAGASVAFGLAGSVEALDAARLVQGIGGAAIWTGSLTWLSESSPPGRQGQMVGTALGIGIAGALLGPVIGSVAELTDARIVFAAVAAVLVALAGCALAVPGPRHRQASSVGEIARAVRRDRGLLAGFWCTLLPSGLFGVLGVLAPLRLSALGVGTVALGAVFLAGAAIEAVATPFVGRATDRRGPLPLIRIGLAGSVVFAALLPLPDAAWLSGAATVLAGVVFGMAWVPASALLTAGADRHGLHHGLAYALWNLAWALGQTLGAAAGAPLAQATSDGLPYWLLAALCAVTLAVLAARTPLRPRPAAA
jgi:predicted MFS family arabinose efflux permease